MNLLRVAKGSTYWTADHTQRVRIEQRVGDTEVFICSVFNHEGERLCSRNYHANGIPVHGDIYALKLCDWNPSMEAVRTPPATKQHGTAATKGHLACNGGLRGHSVGDTFPFIVFAQGTMDGLVWRIRCPNGEVLGEYPSAQYAEDIALSFKFFS